MGWVKGGWCPEKVLAQYDKGHDKQELDRVYQPVAKLCHKEIHAKEDCRHGTDGSSGAHKGEGSDDDAA